MKIFTLKIVLSNFMFSMGVTVFSKCMSHMECDMVQVVVHTVYSNSGENHKKNL